MAGSPAPGRGNSAARGGFRVQRAVARVRATGLRWGPSASSSWRRGLSFEVSLSVWGRQRTFLRYCARPWPDFPRCAAQVWWRAIARTTFAGVQRERVCVPPPPPPLHTHTHTRFANCPRVCQLQGMVSVEGQAQRTAMAAAIAGEYGGLCSFKNQMTHDAMSYLAGRFDRGEVDGEKVKQYGLAHGKAIMVRRAKST
eukprot:COSAG03_NODE_5496_length_1235_cov_1.792254_2_plen_198_part_00